MELVNIREGTERVIKAVNESQNISIFVDPDVDGLCSSYLMYDYLKNKLEYPNVSLFWNERSQGHGINESYEEVPDNTNLLLLIDSSTSDKDACKILSSKMDIVIIDHHNPENDNPYALIVNPQLQKEYENKSSSATLVTFKFIELMDYVYQKVNMNDYFDVTGMSLMSDQMDLSHMENRFFVYHGMKRIKNVGLLALIHASKNGNKKINSQIMNYSIIPMLNTVARNDELKKGIMILCEKDFFKAKRMANILVEQNKHRKDKVKNLVDDYMNIIQDEKFAYVVTENSSKGFNGLCASKIGSTLMKPCFVLKDNGDTYQGSYRSYNNFQLQTFLKDCPYTELAAGHEPAGGFSIKAENWEKFKQYVNENIDDSMFEPIIEYDIQLTEDELTWDIVDSILEMDTVWGNGSPKINIKLTDVFVEDKELFPPKTQEHVKIKAGNIDIMKFGDSEYARDVDSWDNVDVIGNIDINDYRKDDLRIQLFVEDYMKH